MQFVVYEQFFKHMPGSPARSVKGSSSTSSSACWGPGALASLGHGRQTLHIIGSRAAAATGVDLSAPEPWVSQHNTPGSLTLWLMGSATAIVCSRVGAQDAKGGQCCTCNNHSSQ